MSRSPRSRAVEAASEALIGTNWRGWGTLTVARRVVKAMEDAGFRLVKMPERTLSADVCMIPACGCNGEAHP